MTVELTVGGRRRAFEVRRVADGWVVGSEGREVFANLAKADGRWSLLLAPVGEGEGGRGRGWDGEPRPTSSYEVAIEAGRAGELTLAVNGRAIAVTVAGRDRRSYATESPAGIGSKHIVATMPGRIVKVLVAPGQEVAAGQAVVVVEAMKMESELRAPAAGFVRAVRVAEGSAVDAKAVLVEID